MANSRRRGNKLTLLAALPQAYLECRYYRTHALIEDDGLSFVYRDTRGTGQCVVGVCARCGTRREDYINARGEKVDTHYEWPDDYSLGGMMGINTITSFDIRWEMARRIKDRKSDSVNSGSPNVVADLTERRRQRATTTA